MHLWKKVEARWRGLPIKHDGSKYFIVIEAATKKTKTLRGITGSLSATFWPDYLPPNAKQRRKPPPARPQTTRQLVDLTDSDEELTSSVFSYRDATPTPKPRKITKKPYVGSEGRTTRQDATTSAASSPWEDIIDKSVESSGNALQSARMLALANGTAAHEHLAYFTRIVGIADNRTPDEPTLRAALRSVTDMANNDFHPAAQTCLRSMRDQWGLAPVGAKVPVCSLEELGTIRWCTELDLVAVPASQDRLMLIEFKTGRADSFEIGIGQMAGGMKMSNSSLNQAKVQLVASAMLFTTMNSDIPFDMCVIFVAADGTCPKLTRISPGEYDHIKTVLREEWINKSYERYSNPTDTLGPANRAIRTRTR